MNKQQGEGLVLIATILTIIYLSQTINWSFLGWNKGEKTMNSPITLYFEPKFINEGQYDTIPITITIPNIKKFNITSLDLIKSNVKVDRLYKKGDVDIASLSWDGYNDYYVLSYSSNAYSLETELTAKGKLSGCKNCFMGEQYPYQFKFVISYSVNNGPIEFTTLNVTVPIT